jgi:hypothetical protein
MNPKSEYQNSEIGFLKIGAWFEIRLPVGRDFVLRNWCIYFKFDTTSCTFASTSSLIARSLFSV